VYTGRARKSAALAVVRPIANTAMEAATKRFMMHPPIL
jgi:hypothetical protein